MVGANARSLDAWRKQCGIRCGDFTAIDAGSKTLTGTMASRAESRYGSGESTTLLSREKMAVVAPNAQCKGRDGHDAEERRAPQ